MKVITTCECCGDKQEKEMNVFQFLMLVAKIGFHKLRNLI